MASRLNPAEHCSAGPSNSQETGGNIFLMRHATAEHNGHNHYPHRDPRLAPDGLVDAQQAVLTPSSPDFPDLILISPLTRALQTAQIVFGSTTSLMGPPEVQIWPDLRESNNTISSLGQSAAVLREKFPMYDFSECHEEWDYAKETHQRAVARAERVRSRIKKLCLRHRRIWVITHSIFLSYLVNVNGHHFWTCEARKYRFATEEETSQKRYGLNHDLRCRQDFGPTVLIRKE
ncbi:histidine phosphatase superfamily [Truncatella angustata]|uniref:Histidine phosphatase superfamily n=1 Tax=Truncatella angustata TaxID=152316 RepID=A0A9P8U8I7_9PEZI|nr:histidine phosphatase superfamily [Truncatella angustata]KAH6645244.1 histidine phosphatase superfamily [Truncatella angustata]KAH8200602.1 hypothetical protein TruAng_005254 [Truncatella angustata]